MKIYIHPASPNCVAVLALAGELELDLQTEVVDLFGQANLRSDFLAINPNGMVPVLEDNGFVLWETGAILQYLAATSGSTKLLAKDERARADVTRWQVWSIAHWHPALQTFIYQNLFRRLRGQGEADPNALAEAMPRLVKYASVLNSVLSEREWLCGDQLSLADLSAGSHLIYAEPARVPLEQYSHLLSWWSRLRARRAWIAAEAGMPRFGAN